MANPITITVALDAADPDGIAVAQSLGAAGNLALNGALVVGGVAYLTDPGVARQVVVSSVGNDSGLTFTLYGTNATGNNVMELLPGANAGDAESSQYFRTITRVEASGATAGNVSVGTTDEGSSRAVNIDTALNPCATSIAADVEDTVTYTLQWTADDIQEAKAAWANDPNMAAKSAAFSTSNTFPVSGYRLLVTAGTGTVKATILQSGLGS